MLSGEKLTFLKQFAQAIAKQFGQDCEVVVHNIDAAKAESHIEFIENGHVSSRSVGEDASHVVLEAMRKDPAELHDRLAYLTRTHDGRILKSSTLYIKAADGQLDGILSINYDISALLTVDRALKALLAVEADVPDKEPQTIPQTVNELLDDLIRESVKKVGKPVALMNKEDKMTAIQFLNQNGAFLITKSGDKISKFFNISKYTMYGYIDAKQGNSVN
ncbi:transcriptional regulator [Oscillospiraceae bacterium HV4-5-C5C]|nr:transcriptional regulator [Oscillospiraceae bacterium HV4-5-C5C]